MCFREITPSKLRLGVRGIRLASLANAQMQFEAVISLAHIFFIYRNIKSLGLDFNGG